jgi:hypothetical protein
MMNETDNQAFKNWSSAFKKLKRVPFPLEKYINKNQSTDPTVPAAVERKQKPKPNRPRLPSTTTTNGRGGEKRGNVKYVRVSLVHSLFRRPVSLYLPTLIT